MLVGWSTASKSLEGLGCFRGRGCARQAGAGVVVGWRQQRRDKERRVPVGRMFGVGWWMRCNAGRGWAELELK